MKNPTFLLVICLIATIFSSTASAGLVVTMSGTIGTGTLNGVAIDDAPFNFEGTLESSVDLDSRSGIGVFALSQASMEVNSTVFEFLASETYWGQFNTNYGTEPSWGFNILVSETPDDFERGNVGFGYDNNGFSPSPPFDGDVFAPLSYDNFGNASTYGSGRNMATFVNGTDELSLTSVISTSASSVTAVPEPTLASLLSMVLLCCRYRKRS